MDEVDLAEVFGVRACVIKFMRGAHRGAMKLSLQKIQRGSAANNSIVETRGWKLFLLQERMSKFASGEWELLLSLPLESSLQGISASCTSCRRQRDTVASRVSGAIGLANSVELSNARQALEGNAVAPSNERTWKLLTDEQKAAFSS